MNQTQFLMFHWLAFKNHEARDASFRRGPGEIVVDNMGVSAMCLCNLLRHSGPA